MFGSSSKFVITERLCSKYQGHNGVSKFVYQSHVVDKWGRDIILYKPIIQRLWKFFNFDMFMKMQKELQ